MPKFDAQCTSSVFVCRPTRRKSVKSLLYYDTHITAYCELRMERRAVCTSTASKISVARIKTVTGARRPRPNWGPARRQACDAPNNAWLQYIAKSTPLPCCTMLDCCNALPRCAMHYCDVAPNHASILDQCKSCRHQTKLIFILKVAIRLLCNAKLPQVNHNITPMQAFEWTKPSLTVVLHRTMLQY